MSFIISFNEKEFVSSNYNTTNQKIYLSKIIEDNFKREDFIITAKLIYINGESSELLDLHNSSISEDVQKVIFYGFCDSNEAKNVYWDSSAHILGHALINLFNAKLVNGSVIEEGFYYDVDVESPISEKDFLKIEKEMKNLAKKGSKFLKKLVPINYLKEKYAENECKLHLIKNNIKEENVSVCRNVLLKPKGDLNGCDETESFIFEDMCEGPHIPNSGMVKTVLITKGSSCYFLDNAKNKSLQRIYGITFPSKDLMAQYKEKIEKAKEMDHRKLGKDLNLFFFNECSPGSCFWLPDGAYIFNKLQAFLRSEYQKRGFSEVITPNIYSVDLFKESGHYQNYRDDMFMTEGGEFGLKPMNCPGHCIMFRNMINSYKELPLRLADFGVLHRNEYSGSLSGLTRVRRFQQDDAHIFVTESQIKSEILSAMDFLKSVYDVFNYKYELLLSTRPVDKFLGKVEDWDFAENMLKEAILESGNVYKLNAGDGAFYGPKIDIILLDSLGRKIQCATIQLDFQLPLRFKLKYKDQNGVFKAPIMIHRAILGSLERHIGILIENFGKKIPFWLNPKQIAILLIASEMSDYATELVNGPLSHFKTKIYSDSKLTLNKKVRLAEMDGFRVVCLVGRDERDSKEINVRTKNNNKNYKIYDFVKICNRMNSEKIEPSAVFE